MNDYSTATDLKGRFGGVLENPYVSKVHRHTLDGFKVIGLTRILKPVPFESLLDVGCGLGEYSVMKRTTFVGLDNSFPRAAFAQKWFKKSLFLQADAVNLPFKDKSFDAVLLANTLHHLSDEQALTGIKEMKRVSRRYLIIDDCIKWPGQNGLSRFFYGLDRGTMFRTIEQIEALLLKEGDLKRVLKDNHLTFPGLYRHGVIVMEIDPSP